MISRVAVGMGIPTGFPYGWEFILAYGISHMWESYGKSSFPYVGILWEFPQKSCGNGMGMGMKIHFPRQTWIFAVLPEA